MYLDIRKSLHHRLGCMAEPRCDFSAGFTPVLYSRAIRNLYRQLIAVIDHFQNILRFIQPVGLRNAISNSSQSVILHGSDGLYINMLGIELQMLLQRIHTVLFRDIMDAHI